MSIKDEIAADNLIYYGFGRFKNPYESDAPEDDEPEPEPPEDVEDEDLENSA